MNNGKTELGHCLGMLLHETGWRQMQLADIIGYDQGALSKVISGKRRVSDVHLLARMCHCWPDRAQNLRALMAHLRDVIYAAGYDYDTDVEVRARGQHASDVQADADLVYAEALANEHVGRLVVALATIIRSMMPAQIAAEAAESYDADPEPT